MDLATINLPLESTSGFHLLEQLSNKHVMTYNVSSLLALNTSNTDPLFQNTTVSWRSLFYTTVTDNYTLDNVTFLTSYGKSSPRYDIPHSFLSILRERMNNFVVPAAISVGVLGNLLLVLVFMFTPLRYNSLCHYLTALGVSDLIYLLSCMAVWITGRGIRFQNTMGVCQITMFALLLFRFLDTWYLFAAHVERIVAQFWHGNAQKLCTTFRSKCIIVVIFVFSLVGFSHYMWIHVVIEYKGIHSCLLMQESRKHILELGKVEVIFASFLPMLLIVLLDVTLIAKLVAQCAKSVFNPKKKQKDKVCNLRGDYAPASEVVAMSLSISELQGSDPRPTEFNISREKTRVTLMVVVAGVIFIALTLPASIFRAKQYFTHLARPSKQDMEIMFFSEEIVMFNSVYKIFLYVAALKSFRRGLVYLCTHGFRRRKLGESGTQSSV